LLQKKRLEITESHAIEALKGINKEAWTSIFLAGGIKGLCGFIFYVCQSFFILRWSWGVAVHWEWKGGLMNIYHSFSSLDWEHSLDGCNTFDKNSEALLAKM